MQEIIVIGGGASGMAAAITAARAGADAVILEHNDIPGKKLLSTGNGRCNLTNQNLKSEYYRGDDPKLIRQVIAQFDTEDALAFFRSLGICTKCRGEYIYPLCDQASAVREAFALELKRLGVRVAAGCHVQRIEKCEAGFRIFCGKEKPVYRASKVILAAGSQASEISGSDGSGYELAKELGHSISPVVPALVQLRTKEKYFKKLAGVRITAQVSVWVNGEFKARDTGELQLTDYGISGIPVFQISRYAAKALYEKKDVRVRIDFMPHISQEELLKELLERQRRFGKRTAEELLNTLFPSKLIPVLLSQAGIERSILAEKLSERKLRAFVHSCKSLEVSIAGTNPFGKAQVCAGGVRTQEIDPDTMESRLVKGLYLTGELLDVDGICGGYNLHFAWGSGILAGRSAAR